MWQIKRLFICAFNHITFLMRHMTCLNNNVDILIPYKLPSSGLEEIPPKEIQYCETDQVNETSSSHDTLNYINL